MIRKSENPESQAIQKKLRRIAKIASVILDGEDVKQIITDEAMRHIANPDTEYRFLSADHYDVNHHNFLRVKKLLMRIERLAETIKADGSVWIRVPESDDVTVAVHNGLLHRYDTFGRQKTAMPEEMRSVFETGEIAAAPSDKDGKYATVLAPVRDSLQDIVAVLELTALLDPVISPVQAV